MCSPVSLSLRARSGSRYISTTCSASMFFIDNRHLDMEKRDGNMRHKRVSARNAFASKLRERKFNLKFYVSCVRCRFNLLSCIKSPPDEKCCGQQASRKKKNVNSLSFLAFIISATMEYLNTLQNFNSQLFSRLTFSALSRARRARGR